MNTRISIYRNLVSMFLFIFLWAGCDNSTNPFASNDKSDIPTTEIIFNKFILNNGLTVIVNEDHKAPLVAVNIWYKVGSKDEHTGQRGFAHLFEHLMFQGSENYDNDFFKPFEEAGATDQNGTTNSDRTNYFQTIPKAAIDMALWMESDRMGHFTGAITQEKLDEQRDVVKNEKRQGENQPYGKVWNRIAEQTFPNGHPYSWPTIGYMEDLDAADLNLVKDWFKTFYGPSNAVLVLAGDITLEEAKEKTKKYFGDIPAGIPIAKLESWIAKRTEDKRDSMQDRVTQSRILKIWNTDRSGSIDSEHLALAADILGGGKNSRIYKRLVHNEKIATSAGVMIYDRLLAGQFIIYANAKEGIGLDVIENAINEELSEFLKNGPSSEELYRVQFSQATNFVRATERIGGFGGKSDILAHGETYFGQPDYYLTSLNILKQATPELIKNAGQTWLSNGAYTLSITPFPEYSQDLSEADRSTLPKVPANSELFLPAIERATLSNGLKVLFMKRNQTPTIEMELLFDAGIAADNEKSGLSGMTMSMLDEGTANMSSLELAESLEMLGTNLSTGNNLDSSIISLDTLKVSLDKSLSILGDILTNPTFRESDLERVRQQLLAKIDQEKSSPRSIISRTLPTLLYGDKHIYNKPWSGSGTIEAVKSLQREDLITFWREWIRPDNASLIITGDTNLQEITNKLETHLSNWDKKNVQIPTKVASHVSLPENGRVYWIDYPDTSQSIIIAAQLVMPINDNKSLAFSLMNDIIGGQFSSRLNMNLREDKHWAYGASSYTKSNKAQRPYLITTSVQADKTGAAIQEILDEYNALIGKNQPTLNEINSIKTNRLNTLLGTYETNSSLVSAMSYLVEYSLPDNFLYNSASRIQDTSTKQIQSVANSTLQPDKFIWLITGDLQKNGQQLEKLKLGDIIVLDKNGNIISKK